jgi:hypothetical protein
VSVSSAAYSEISSVLVSSSIVSLMSSSFEFITLLIDFFLFIKFQIEQVIDSAIDEAREIFEHKDDIKNETVEEETSTEEIPEQAAEETDTNSDATFNEVSKELEDNLFEEGSMLEDNLFQEEETTETSEPSKDIDLGSVQEV